LILNRCIFCIAFIITSISVKPVKAQDLFTGYEQLFTTPRQYTIYKTKDPIKIDGKLKEASWSKAEWSDDFVDIEGNKKPVPPLKTRFKMLWDTQYVYIAAELEEPNTWATLKHHDDIVFNDNDFEIFIDPDGDMHNYFEIEVNALNTIFDLFLTKPYRNGGVALINWDVQQLKSAVSVQGSVNNTRDIDKKWFVEMAISLRSIATGFKEQVPADGSFWRINFSRVEYETEIVHGNYIKKADSVSKRPLPEHNWVWSPQGPINMHMPERWGYLQFSTQNAGSSKINMPLPAAETYKKYLWLLFYKQQQYRQQHLQYATDLPLLNFPSTIESAGLNCHIELVATGLQYIAVLQPAGIRERWQIDQDGKISKASNP
jgi:hypothetical protein